MLDDDDDFQIPLSLTQASIRKPLKPTNSNSNSTRRPSKKPKRSGKENVNVPGPTATQSQKSQLHDFESSDLIGCCTSSSLDSIRSSIVDCTDSTVTDEKKGLMKISGGYLCNSIESRLLNYTVDNVVGGSENEMGEDLDLLLNLCSDSQLEEDLVRCPLCGIDISDMSNQQRQIHTNQCLDKDQTQPQPQLQQHVISLNSLFFFSYVFVYILNANIWAILFRLFFRMMAIKVNLKLLGKLLMFLLYSCGCAALV